MPYFPAKQRTAEYREGLYVVYRYFETAKVPVLVPFGFGLSYTTFEYSDLTVTGKEASFTLKNTGKVDGAEVAQLYVSKLDGEVFRPTKELEGFAKVFLKAGESKKVTIPFDDKAFRYFNVENNKFEVEGGEWTVMIGASVADIRLTGTVTVKGTGTKSPYDKTKLPDYFSGNVKHIPDSEFETLLGHPIPDGHWSERHPDHERRSVSDVLRQERSGSVRLQAADQRDQQEPGEGKAQPEPAVQLFCDVPQGPVADVSARRVPGHGSGKQRRVAVAQHSGVPVRRRFQPGPAPDLEQQQAHADLEQHESEGTAGRKAGGVKEDRRAAAFGGLPSLPARKPTKCDTVPRPFFFQDDGSYQLTPQIHGPGRHGGLP